MTIMFDHEKLEVYQLELKLIAWVVKLLPEVQAKVGRKAESRTRTRTMKT